MLFSEKSIGVSSRVEDLVYRLGITLYSYEEASWRFEGYFPFDVVGTSYGFYYPPKDYVSINVIDCAAAGLSPDHVALHEIIHWTGHQRRLARETIIAKQSYRFVLATEDHTEEATAYLGAYYLAETLGMADSLAYAMLQGGLARYNLADMGKAQADARAAVAWILRRVRIAA